MKIDVKKGKLTECRTEALVVLSFENTAAPEGSARVLDEACGGLIGELIRSGDFQGKRDQIAVLHTRGLVSARRVLLAGLGPKEKFDLEKLRGAMARAARQVRALNLKEFHFSLDFDDPMQPVQIITEAAVEGIILGLYQFTTYKTLERDQINEIARATMVVGSDALLKPVSQAVLWATSIADAVCYCRDLVSTPGNDMTPTDLARAARVVAKKRHVTLQVLDAARMKKMGMHALLGVACGSDEPPRFIILSYRNRAKAAQPILLVGKGLTFDSGGISIKPSEKMEEMKSDMAGGAAVIGAIMAAADLKLPLNIIGLIPATENLPGGSALKPGDILTSLSGQTIEIVNTDAEGRLILADALTYAQRYKPMVIIDLATLTGACKVALGDHVIGMLGNDDAWKERIRTAADQTGERVWELPLWEAYQELIKSDVADYKNAGGRVGGTITAAAFLSRFVGDYPWVHLDIAGPAWLSKDMPYASKGASGVGVRLVVQFLRNWSSHAAPA